MERITWPPSPGQKMWREQIKHAAFQGTEVGGSIQPGIIRPKTISEVLLFMGEGGETSGYGKFDYFIPGEPRVSYTGAGRYGNQDPERADNQYVISASLDTVIRFFWRPSKKKPYEYVGRVRQCAPWRMERAPDLDGLERDVIVFTFDILGDAEDKHIPLTDKPPVVLHSDSEWQESAEDDFDSPGSPGGKRKRKEHSLQNDFGRWLKSKGNDVRRQTLEGQVPDFVDASDLMVIEAKRSSERQAIRQAIGQVLDYADIAQRTGTPLKPAILVPVRPDSDRARLVLNLGITLIYRDDKKGFVYEYPEDHQSNKVL